MPNPQPACSPSLSDTDSISTLLIFLSFHPPYRSNKTAEAIYILLLDPSTYPSVVFLCELKLFGDGFVQLSLELGGASGELGDASLRMANPVFYQCL